TSHSTATSSAPACPAALTAPTPVKISARVKAISTPMMIPASSRKAAALCPASPMFSRRSTPSGVTKGRSVLSILAASADTRRLPSWTIEVEPPDQGRHARHGVAQTGVGDQLPSEALQQTGEQQHDDDPAHHHASGPPGLHGGVQSVRPSGEGDGPA